MSAAKNQRSQQGDRQTRLPVFLNSAAGSAETVMPVLDGDARVRLHCLPVTQLAAAIDQEIVRGRSRIIVCGGDGTLALAAARLAGSKTELAVLPGGTLNHFASRLGIPADPQEALKLAIDGVARPVAAGYVNDRLFLNTSSVGAYVFFVRTREQLESRLNYHLASLLAGLRRLVRFRSAKINLNGSIIRSPLVFIGVHERELRFPTLGQKKTAGDEGLHIIAVKSRSRRKTLKIACKAIFCGIDPLEQAEEVENLILERFELNYQKKKQKLVAALDGELVSLAAPLHYRFEPAALSVVVSEKPETS